MLVHSVVSDGEWQRSSQTYKNQPLTYHLDTRGNHLTLVRSLFALSQTKAIRVRNSLGNIPCKKLQQKVNFDFLK